MTLSNFVTKFIKRSGLVAASAVIVASTIAAGVVTFTQPSVASAACSPQDTYPQTNVIYCGLGGSTATELMNSYKTYYNSNNDGHGHTDLQAVYNAAHFNTGMFTTGHWSVGTSYKDGTIVADGYVVGTNVQIASRCYLANMGNCQPPSRYTHLTSDVYTRDATWFFDTSATSKPTLVHFDDNGVADFALWTPCGNALLFKAKPLPKILKCVSLDKTVGEETDTTLAYTFTAVAVEQYNTTGTLTLDFGDGSSVVTKKVDQPKVTLVAAHTYQKTTVEQTIYVVAAVEHDFHTNIDCAVQVVIPPKPPKPPVKQLACVQLTAAPTDSTKFNYTFTATASANNTTITSYTFDYYNNGQVTQTFNSSNSSFTTPVFSYDKTKTGTFTARVSVTGPLGTFTSDACTVSVTIPPQPPLVNTGPGSVIAIFGLTTTLGGLFHQFVLRRKFLS